MDDFDDEDEFAAAGVAEAEQRHDLQRDVAIGTTVEFQAAESGSVLSLYMADRRRMAMAALVDLAHADPRDAIEVGRLQSVVREYLNVRDWVRQKIEAADDADAMLKEAGHGEEADDTDGTVRAPIRRAARARRRR